MRKGFITFLMTLLVAVTYALPIESISSAASYELHNGKDTLLIFDGDIDLRTKDTIGEVLWYSIETGEPLETQPSEEQYRLDDGGYYVVKDGVESSPFYVFRYTEPGALTLSLAPECGGTPLTVQGEMKPYTYKRRNGTTATYARACAIYYNELAWSGEAWEDSAAVNVPSEGLQSYYDLPALYGPTTVRLCVESNLRAHLGRTDSVCYETELRLEDIKAVKMQLIAYATPHDATNELNRLKVTKYTKEQEVVKGGFSGPLEIEFRSNPTPGVQFYQWTVYNVNTSEVLFTRKDKDIYYTFYEPGAYGVECSVNNATCSTEPDDIKVNISESYLRVPNVFTPDGNGQNDEFRVSYRSIKSFHCEVYNRWGKKVFQWDDPAKGWDGTINGRAAAEGAYYYVIRALGTDAGLSTDGAKLGIYNLSGDINLLRGKK